MRTSLLPAYGLAAALMLVFTLAACDGGGDGGGPGPGLPTAWVSIRSHEPPGDIVPASEVELYGVAECDNCPPSETTVGYCPGAGASLPTAINVTVINQTTGESGITSHGITGHCSCLFSHCILTYAHRWTARSVPLTWGENVIVATAFRAGFTPGTDSITITRAPGTVGNLKATSGKQQVTLRWAPVPDATSYNIYWSTERLVSKATGTMIAGVNSPYTHTGLVDGQTYYYIVTSVGNGAESVPSSVVAATPGWLTESVTATIATGTATSIAMDSGGKAHISSVEATGNGYIFRTYYMTNVTGAWSSLLVDQSSGPSYVGVNADITLDSQNTVHMSLVNSSGLNHAIYASGTWVREVVDPSAVCDASLVLDAANKAHMVYYTPTSVRYATNLNGAWTNVVIEEFGLPVGCINVYDKLSLGVDAAGAAHVAYVSLDSSLRYATNQGGTWSFSSVGSKLITGLSLVVDTRGAVHIVYGENTNYQLHYLHNKSGTWTSEIISSSGYSLSLSLDAAGKAHVSYSSTGLSYASNSSGTWHSATIDSDVSRTRIENNTDIAVDSQGKAHIVYSSYQGIRYATNK